jgi:hypothetical protein
MGFTESLLFVLLPGLIFVLPLWSVLFSDRNGENKLLWVLVILFIPLVGAVLYFIVSGFRSKNA